jgi:ribonuclease HI
MNNSYFIYCDGGARGNPGPAASAFVVYNSSHHLVFETSQPIGQTTNNQAEYQAVIFALEWLSRQNLTGAEITFYFDSQLLVNQLKGLYKIKDLILKQKYQIVAKLINSSKFKVKNYIYIPRRQNSRADFLVNQALDKALIL